ncbi:MAG TPA: trigger factor [Candidatus Angelobacter sp.]|nr:trigger factor [Candidatus Angelobacter sp.]
MDAEKETTETTETAAVSEESAKPAGQAGDVADSMEEACRREVSVEIPADVVSKEQDAVVKAYSRQARVPGFRKGKVPASVVRNRFSSEISSEVLETLVPQYFRQAVIDAGLRPVSQPFIYDLKTGAGEAVRFKAVFEVLPDFELAGYRDIKVEKPDTKVSDEEVDAELKHLQERQASFDPVNEERGAEDGEFAQVSFTATAKEEGKTATEPSGAGKEGESASPEAASPAAQPVEMNDVMVEIGAANTLPEFSQNLRGVKPGGERSFEVAYPADFHDQRLAGKVFNYHVKVNAIKKKVLPDLNDAFARELNQEFETLDLLKQRMRENMETQKSVQAEQAAKEQLVEKLLEKHDFAVPRALVEHQIDLRLERGLRALAAQGMRTEDMKRMDFGRLRAGQREAAVKEVKSSLLLGRIAEAEDIQVSNEELEHEISHLAEQLKQTPEEVRQRLAKEGALERIRGRMRSEKALDFLYGKTG